PDGTLLFVDVLRLRPTDGEGPRSLGLLGGKDVLATLHILTQHAPAPELVEILRCALADGDVLAGVSELPNACGATVRLLGQTSKAVRAGLADAWNAARLALLGAPAPDLPKG